MKTSLVLAALLSVPCLGQSDAPALWFWQHAFPVNASELKTLETQLSEAVSYGYTGVAFWSSAFAFMGSEVHPAPNAEYMRQLAAYARKLGMQTIAGTTPFGYSDDALINNPNWAEGEPINGSRFAVNPTRTALVRVNSFGGLENAGFESGRTAWFDWKDGAMGVDTTVAHSGSASGYVTKATGNARFAQPLKLIPRRQYHARIWVKTSNFSGYSQIIGFDQSTNKSVFGTEIHPKASQDWTAVDFAFSSKGTANPVLLFGVWGGSSGTIWFDDVLVEETSLVYVLRRPGTPLKAYNPASPQTLYQEGKDFNPIVDPQLAAGGGFNGFYHTPATVTLPPTTSLQAGQTVAFDYYAVQPVSAVGDVGICLTEPEVQTWMRVNARAIVGNMGAGTDYLLSYDEMRHMDSCAVCKSKNLTPGQLLARHVADNYKLYRSLSPKSSFYIWNDMFDPYQNAVNNYYNVEGDLAGSWKGIPADVTILNWNLSNLAKSLDWFSGTNPEQPVHYKQIIAGYYDSGNGAAAATQELRQAVGIPGVTGLMYTTWNNDYSQLKAFAAAAKSNWGQYLSTVPK